MSQAMTRIPTVIDLRVSEFAPDRDAAMDAVMDAVSVGIARREREARERERAVWAEYIEAQREAIVKAKVSALKRGDPLPTQQGQEYGAMYPGFGSVRL